MTLIVGIKCSDGVVVGADSAATLGDSLGQRTVIEPVAKLHILQDRMIVGVAGPVGLAQLYADRIDTLWKQNKLGRTVNLPQVMRELRDAILQDAKVAIESAAASVPFMGNAAQLGAVSSTLVALGVQTKPELVQCNYHGSPEATTDELPYVAIGSGQSLADPFLAFLRRMFWPTSPPKLADGVFAAVWTLQHAIRVAPGGLGGPIHIATIGHKGQDIVARLLEQSELDEHSQNVADAEKHVSQFGKNQTLAPALLPPQPPAKPT